MQLRIRLLVKMTGTVSAATGLNTLHGSIVSLHSSRVSLYGAIVSLATAPAFHFDADPAQLFTLICIWLFTSVPFRIRLPNVIRIRNTVSFF